MFIDFSAHPARCNSRHLSPAAHFLINCVSAALSEPQAGRRRPPKWPRLRLLGVPFVDTRADSRGSVLRSTNDQRRWPSSQDQAELEARPIDEGFVSTFIVCRQRPISSLHAETRRQTVYVTLKVGGRRFGGGGGGGGSFAKLKLILKTFIFPFMLALWWPGYATVARIFSAELSPSESGCGT